MKDVIDQLKVLKLKLEKSDVNISDLSKAKHMLQKKITYFTTLCV